MAQSNDENVEATQAVAARVVDVAGQRLRRELA